LPAAPGVQFTSIDVIKVLASAEIRIGMDGKGAWRDNVFVERLCRIIKYEKVFRHACVGVSAARTFIGRHPGFCNSPRPHSSLDAKTSDQACFNQPMPDAAAAQPGRKTTYEKPGNGSDKPGQL